MEQSVQAYLSALPTCHQFVLVADPELGEGEYFCSVILSASDLLAWHRKEAETTTVYSWDRKVRRRALPLWLEHARIQDGEVVELPRNAFRDIQGAIADWVEAGQAHVWCYHCESWVDDLAITKEDEIDMGPLGRSWTDLWCCGNGHKLHESRQEIRWIIRKDRSLFC